LKKRILDLEKSNDEKQRKIVQLEKKTRHLEEDTLKLEEENSKLEGEMRELEERLYPSGNLIFIQTRNQGTGNARKLMCRQMLFHWF